MKIDSPPAGFEAFRGAEIFNYGHLPTAAAYCRRLGLVEVVNNIVSSEMDLSPGVIVQAMVLDTLSGRSPLYRIKEFLAGQDVELLVGEDLPANAFSDINVGRSLDAIFKAGPAKIVTELGVRATNTFALDTTVPSYDTTSTSLWGDYRDCEAETPPPGSVITWGHSKDHRPDLKQFMTELLCVDRGVPIFGRNLDGNSSDKTSNNVILSRISSIMAKHGLGPGAFVYVADSAMVTKANLKAVGPNLFVSRLPATYKECERAIGDAVDACQWTHIGPLSETVTRGNRPSARYKVFETSVNLHGDRYRAVVIHSSSHDKRRQKKYDKMVSKSEKSIAKALKKELSTYACEPDAKRAAAQAAKLSDRLHKVSVSISPEKVRKRGRPPKNAPVPTRTRYRLVWKITEDAAAVERLRKMAGCFVLLSNVPIEGERAMDGKCLLKTYKGQYSVESDFAFLKDPLVVNDVFLKTPSRIDALGMILIISLMVWRLMERSMRNHVENTGTLLPGWAGRLTDKPTSFMMTTAMAGIMVARFGSRRLLLCPPQKRPMAFLVALGLGASVFTDPTCRCTPIIHQKQGSKG
jgi:transposase